MSYDPLPADARQRNRPVESLELSSIWPLAQMPSTKMRRAQFHSTPSPAVSVNSILIRCIPAGPQRFTPSASSTNFAVSMVDTGGTTRGPTPGGVENVERVHAAGSNRSTNPSPLPRPTMSPSSHNSSVVTARQYSGRRAFGGQDRLPC